LLTIDSWESGATYSFIGDMMAASAAASKGAYATGILGPSDVRKPFIKVDSSKGSLDTWCFNCRSCSASYSGAGCSQLAAKLSSLLSDDASLFD